MAPSRGSSRYSRLIAVILITRSRPGPHLVFHYPSTPQLSASRRQNDAADESDTDEDVALDVRNGASESVLNGADIHSTKQSDIADNTADKQTTFDSSILGFSEETLQKLLSPGCWSDRKKFEICLDGVTFVGHPMYAAQDGSWARKHSHTQEGLQSERRSPTPTPKHSMETDSADSQASVGITITEPKTPAKQTQDFTHVPESFDSHSAGHSLAASINSGSEISMTAVAEQLTMFNVVFVLASLQSESASREASDLYQHVAKKLSKALHYCQNQTQYIGNESKKLLALKAKARQDGITEPNVLCKQMVENSELAWALQEVYEKISVGDIAGIRLNGMSISLQAPITESSKGLEEIELSRHSGLLLLEDKEVLRRELAHPDASPLVLFIREHTPTKSLQKHAVNLTMPIDDVLDIARHLIKWRKARVINPLHQRNTYIIGREAPLDQLQTHYITDYTRKFAVLLSLPQVLKVLSGKPIKYGMLIPSRDHRAPYMEILAYLVQHRFVEQLKTFGWLQAPTTTAIRPQRVGEEMNQNRLPLSVTSLLSPQMRPVSDDDTASVSSERTTIPISVIDRAKKRDGLTSPGQNGAPDELGDAEAFKIIANPDKLSLDNTLRLQHIRDFIHDQELSERLPSLLRHFDGESAFEEIAASEGLKRSKVEFWLDTLQRAGFLMSFRSL